MVPGNRLAPFTTAQPRRFLRGISPYARKGQRIARFYGARAPDIALLDRIRRRASFQHGTGIGECHAPHGLADFQRGSAKVRQENHVFQDF